jgi:CheY-like chemotaxis protein
MSDMPFVPALRCLVVEANDPSTRYFSSFLPTARINKSLRVLIVDDYPELRRMIVRTLNRAGFSHVTAVGDGYACMEYVEGHWVDVVLLDINMPGVSGMEVCQWLKRVGQNTHTQIIACTAHAQAVHRPMFLAAGFDELLVKPFGADELFDAVTRVRC